MLRRKNRLDFIKHSFHWETVIWIHWH